MTTLPIYLAPLEVRIMGDAHDFGGSVTLWGSWRKHGERLIARGLMSVIAATREDGRLALHVRLRSEEDAEAHVRHGWEPVDVAAIADLAARCSYAITLAGKLSERLGKLVTARWRFVPTTLPPRRAPAESRVCAGCFCDASRPCTIQLEDSCGTGTCLPAGVLGFSKCSACQFGSEVLDVAQNEEAAGGPAQGEQGPLGS